MSDSLSSVSWRLNELLKAGKKARAFAKSPWGESESSMEFTPFSPMQPKTLDTLPDGARETESIDLNEDQDGDAQEELMQQEAVEPEEAVQPVLPQFSEEDLEQAKQEADAQGYQRGLDEGNNQWREAREAFLTLVDMFRSAQSNTEDFYKPLKRLSVRLAEELVRGELTLSSAAIERLVKDALKDIEQQGEGPIVIYLNPQDLEHFSLKLDDQHGNIDLRADQQLSKGSLRVNMDDSAIEDFIEKRLQSLTESLLGLDAESAGGNSADYKFANPVEEKVIEDIQITDSDNLDTDTEQPETDHADTADANSDDETMANSVEDKEQADLDADSETLKSELSKPEPTEPEHSEPEPPEPEQ